MSHDKIITLTREQLYDRVWKTPMRTLAVEFGLSDVGLAKVCKRHKIPRPSRGYWAKLERGKKVEQWPLVPVKDESLITIQFTKSEPPAKVLTPVALAADPEIAALIEAESRPESFIEALTELRSPDPYIAATRDSLSGRDADDYGRVSRRWDFQGVCFEVCVSKQSIQRALLLLHTLVRAFRRRNFTIGEDSAQKKQPQIDVLGRKFRLSIWEPSKRQKRELTKQEKEELKKYAWSSIRDYEHVPTGKLELHLDRDSYSSGARFSDTAKAPLEQRLNQVVVAMLQAVDLGRIQAEQQRLQAIEANKQKQVAIEQEIIRRSDGMREQRMSKSIQLWKYSQRVKNYIEAVRREAICRQEEVDASSEVGQWLVWAARYLASLDPLDDHRELPSLSLTAEDLDRLRHECEADWCDWSKSFRPRQPR